MAAIFSASCVEDFSAAVALCREVDADITALPGVRVLAAVESCSEPRKQSQQQEAKCLRGHDLKRFSNKSLSGTLQSGGLTICS